MTPYKQAFVVALDNGAIALAVVGAPHQSTGRHAAKLASEASLGGKAWDVCAYPTTDAIPLGVQVLRPADPVTP